MGLEHGKTVELKTWNMKLNNHQTYSSTRLESKITQSSFIEESESTFSSCIQKCSWGYAGDVNNHSTISIRNGMVTSKDLSKPLTNKRENEDPTCNPVVHLI